MLYIKKYSAEKGSIIAMCDKDLLGRRFSDKRSGMVLDLDRYADFYKGDLVSENAARDIIAQEYVYSANIVGEESTGLIISMGIATGNEVRLVAGVPSLHIYRVV